jgi:hypothetical protein
MITCRKYDDVGPYLLQYYEVRCGHRSRGRGVHGWRFFARNFGHAYITYSYGDHHPLSIAVFNDAIRQGMSNRVPDFYFVNTTRYSNTTSRHAHLVSSWMTSEIRRMAIPCPSHIMQPLAAAVSPTIRTHSIAEIVAEHQWLIEEDRLEDLRIAEQAELEAKTSRTLARVQKIQQKENTCLIGA